MKQCFTRHRPSSNNKKKQTPRSWETHETPAYWLKRLSRLQCRERESWKRQPAPWVEWTELRVQGSHGSYSLEAKYWEKRASQRENSEMSKVPPWVFSCIWNSILIWGKHSGLFAIQTFLQMQPRENTARALVSKTKVRQPRTVTQ